VDQSYLMTLFTQGCAQAAGHRNVRAVTTDAAGDLGIEPGSADLVVASCVANNMLNDIAGHCPNGDTDTVGYARWYHAWDTRPLPLLEQARRLPAADGLLVSVEQNNHEFGIGAWGRMLAPRGLHDRPRAEPPHRMECDCGCRIPLSVLQPAGDGFDKALAAFLAWLSTSGHALRGGQLNLRPEDAAALSGLAGEPLVDLHYRYDGRDVVLRAAELAPFLIFETAALRQLAAGIRADACPWVSPMPEDAVQDRERGIMPTLLFCPDRGPDNDDEDRRYRHAKQYGQGEVSCAGQREQDES
jgi:hypothetical protein